MKRVPRILAVCLIFALLDVSYINIALAGTDPPAKAVPPSPVSTPAPEPEDDPCLPHATKACIQQDHSRRHQHSHRQRQERPRHADQQQQR